MLMIAIVWFANDNFKTAKKKSAATARARRERREREKERNDGVDRLGVKIQLYANEAPATANIYLSLEEHAEKALVIHMINELKTRDELI